MFRGLKLATLAASLVVGAVAARADVRWHVTGTFEDGATLTGYFDIGFYGYLGETDLFTQTGTLAAAEYRSPDPDTSADNGATYVDLQPGPYTSDLRLNFSGDVTSGAFGSVAILPSSYECQDSYGCYDESGGAIRHLVSGVASVPDTATWAMTLAGFGAIGGALRRRRPAPV